MSPAGLDFPDLRLDAPEQDLAAQLKSACSDHGFFFLSEHGVPQQLIEGMMEKQRSLFALPLDAKMKMHVDENNRGYTPFEEETLDPKVQTKGDTKEGFYIGREVACDNAEFAQPLCGPNQWPTDDVLPGYKAVTSEYMQRMTMLGNRMLELLAVSLGLSRDWFSDKFNRPMTVLRPLHYAPQLSHVEGGVFAAGAHTDYGMLTFLLTDDQPGLEIYYQDKWHAVPPRPGSFVVNLGDMLERWTNGEYKSTLHRVVNTTGKERYSVPFFFEPNFDARVECLPGCCKARPAQYPPVTSGNHLLEKLGATHAHFSEA